MARILVIEDDESMNAVLVETLEDEGHEVSSAFTGQSAIELAKTGNFDLAVSDVRLPEIDGVETLTTLKAQHPSMKCIVITGYASADTPIRAIKQRVDDYLFKPFSLDYFLASVNRALAREQERRGMFKLFEKLASWTSKYKNQALTELVAERQEAFRGLYLGVRSGYLQIRAASEIYEALEKQEADFRAILNADTTDAVTIRETQLSYTGISNQIAEAELGKSKNLGSQSIPADQMQALYDAIKSSQIGLDDLQYAPLLRETPDKRFETLPELLTLKRQLWPDLSETNPS